MKRQNSLYKILYNSSIGDLTIVSDGKNIIGLFIENQKYFMEGINEDIVYCDDLEIFIKTKNWLDRYFKGEKVDPLELPLMPFGSSFRQMVWKILLEIPYGEVITYKYISEKIKKITGKKNMSTQAVGGAVSHNPISIIIPCHRVIGCDGSLTGYAGGIDKKMKLLKLEGYNEF